MRNCLLVKMRMGYKYVVAFIDFIDGQILWETCRSFQVCIKEDGKTLSTEPEGRGACGCVKNVLLLPQGLQSRVLLTKPLKSNIHTRHCSHAVV